MKAIRQSTLGVTGLIAVVAVTIAVAVALPRLAPVPPVTATPFSPPTLPASQTPGAYPGRALPRRQSTYPFQAKYRPAIRGGASLPTDPVDPGRKRLSPRPKTWPPLTPPWRP